MTVVLAMRRVGSSAFFVAAVAAMWWVGLKLMAVHDVERYIPPG
jgi:hypothetical protein